MPPRDELPEAYRRGMMQVVHKFKWGDHNYNCHALLPLEQVHMARRLAPIILSALKPEGGRAAILKRLAKIANLSADEGPAPAVDGQTVNDAIELAISVFEAAAATDEEMLNGIIRKVMKKIFRTRESGGAMAMWDSKFDVPTYPDVDGFVMMALVANYIVLEFKDRISEYVSTLGLKPGPALAAAERGAGAQRAPGAPDASAGPDRPFFDPRV